MRYGLIASRSTTPQASSGSVRTRIDQAIDQLQDDPRPPGCKKLATTESWRIRVGDYRIIYDIADVIRIVTIQKVLPRSEAYDSL